MVILIVVRPKGSLPISGVALPMLVLIWPEQGRAGRADPPGGVAHAAAALHEGPGRGDSLPGQTGTRRISALLHPRPFNVFNEKSVNEPRTTSALLNI